MRFATKCSWRQRALRKTPAPWARSSPPFREHARHSCGRHTRCGVPEMIRRRQRAAEWASRLRPPWSRKRPNSNCVTQLFNKWRADGTSLFCPAKQLFFNLLGVGHQRFVRSEERRVGTEGRASRRTEGRRDNDATDDWL